jgi:flavin-dependent dehydrogenase
MIDAEVIVVGGGPAGSTCARKLMLGGKDVLILDKQQFPRLKLCAGWITPKVVKDLDIDLSSYPHSLVTFDKINFYFRHFKLPVKTRQYSIRRIEFDHWLLERSGVPVMQHTVRRLRHENGYYIIDDAFRCKYLIGAGGTNCPVYHAFFKDMNPRSRTHQIVCLEQEFSYQASHDNCHLWFFDEGLVGYSWFVPKGNGVLNVGIGGKLASMKTRGQTIRDHWDHFVAKLENRSLVTGYQFQPKGYQYYLRTDVANVQYDNAFIIGDAAGLATVDMGEGIGPAIESALLAADALLNGRPYTIREITKYSLPAILFGRLI